MTYPQAQDFSLSPNLQPARNDTSKSPVNEALSNYHSRSIPRQYWLLRAFKTT